jgi:hypothetical protein
LGAKNETFDNIISELLDDKETLSKLLVLIKQAEIAFETSKADFRNVFYQLIAMAKAR